MLDFPQKVHYEDNVNVFNSNCDLPEPNVSKKVKLDHLPTPGCQMITLVIIIAEIRASPQKLYTVDVNKKRTLVHKCRPPE